MGSALVKRSQLLNWVSKSIWLRFVRRFRYLNETNNHREDAFHISAINQMHSFPFVSGFVSLWIGFNSCTSFSRKWVGISYEMHLLPAYATVLSQQRHKSRMSPSNLLRKPHHTQIVRAEFTWKWLQCKRNHVISRVAQHKNQQICHSSSAALDFNCSKKIKKCILLFEFKCLLCCQTTWNKNQAQKLQRIVNS